MATTLIPMVALAAAKGDQTMLRIGAVNSPDDIEVALTGGIHVHGPAATTTPRLSAQVDSFASFSEGNFFCLDGSSTQGAELDLIDRNGVMRHLRGVTRLSYDTSGSTITLENNENLMCFRRDSVARLESGAAECSDSEVFLRTGFENNESFAGVAVGVRALASSVMDVDYEISVLNCGNQVAPSVAVRDFFVDDQLLADGSGRWGECAGGPCTASDMANIVAGSRSGYVMASPDGGMAMATISLNPGQTRYFGVRRPVAASNPTQIDVSVVAVLGLGETSSTFSAGTFDLLAVDPPVLTPLSGVILDFDLLEDSSALDLGALFSASDPNPVVDGNPFPNCVNAENCFRVTRIRDDNGVLSVGRVQSSYDPNTGLVSVRVVPQADRYGDNIQYSVAIIDEEGAQSEARTLRFDVANVNDPPVFTVAGGFDRTNISKIGNTLSLDGIGRSCSTTLEARTDGFELVPQGCSLAHAWEADPLITILSYTNFVTGISAGPNEPDPGNAAEMVCAGSVCNMDCFIDTTPETTDDSSSWTLCSAVTRRNPVGIFENVGVAVNSGPSLALGYTLDQNGEARVPGGQTDIVIVLHDGVGGNTRVRIPVSVDRLPPSISVPADFMDVIDENFTGRLGEFTAVDTDGQVDVTWSLVNSSAADRDNDGNNAFRIGRTNGRLIVNDVDDLDVERFGTGPIAITVQATDSLNAVATQELSVTIRDIDDTAPILRGGRSTRIDLAEASGEVTGPITSANLDATDVDTVDGQGALLKDQILYRILNSIADGKFQRFDNGAWTDILKNQTFSQAEVDAGNIRFEQRCISDNLFSTMNLSLEDAVGNTDYPNVVIRLDLFFATGASQASCT